MASAQGIQLSAAAIFKDPRLQAVAAAAEMSADTRQTAETEPFSLLPGDSRENIIGQVRKQCQLSGADTIDDIMPCTNLQEGLLALTIRKPGAYTARNVLKIAPNVNLARFKTAWEQTVLACPNLRTSIILSAGISY